MNIKQLNENFKSILNEDIIQPFVNLKIDSIIDSDGYKKPLNFKFSLTPSDINVIILGLTQYSDTENLVKNFKNLQKLF